MSLLEAYRVGRPGSPGRLHPVLVAALLLVSDCTGVGATGRRPASATTPAGVASTAGAPSPAAPSADHGVVRATLKNGLRVVIVPDHLAPVVTMEVNYRAGSADAPPGFPGTAHAVEHLMFHGSPGLTGDQLTDIIARLGGQMDAYTEEVATHYFITAPVDDLPVLLHVGAARMAGMTSGDAVWKTARGPIEQEVAADLSDPDFLEGALMQQALLGGTHFEHDALGTRPSFDKTTGAMLRHWHDTYYAPNRAVLVLAGDVDPKALLPEVQALFGTVPRHPVPPRPPVHLSPVRPRTLRIATDHGTGKLAIGFRFPGDHHPDYAAGVLLADILDSPRGPLQALVNDGKAISVEFETYNLPPATVAYASVEFARGTDVKTLSALVRGALSQAARHGFSADQVEGARQGEITEAELDKTSIQDLADDWSCALVDRDRRSPDDDVRAVRAVTAAEVNAVARRDLDLDHAVELVFTPQVSGKPVSKAGSAVNEHFAPTKITGVRLPPWAAKHFARLPEAHPLPRAIRSTLPNGLHLVVIPESVSDTVSVYGDIRGDPSAERPRNQRGVGVVLDQAFANGGTATRSPAAFQKALDAIGAKIESGRRFQIKALADHFDAAVALLAEAELHPRLSRKALKVARTEMAGYFRGFVKSPGFVAWRAEQAALVPPKDPTLDSVTGRSVGALTVADVRAYYHAVFRPALTTIVVVGNVDPTTARSVVTKYFGGWKATGRPPTTDLPPVPLNKPSRVRVPDANQTQDKVTLSETVGFTPRNPDYYPLLIGDTVLSGGLNISRLYHDLRRNRGLVYEVWSDFEMSRTRGAYSVHYGCDPKNVSRARAIVVRDLEQLRTSPITVPELHRAQGMLLRSLSLEQASVDTLAGGILGRAHLGFPFDEMRRAAKAYRATDAKAVQAAFHKWIDPKRFVQMVQGPSPK